MELRYPIHYDILRPIQSYFFGGGGGGGGGGGVQLMIVSNDSGNGCVELWPALVLKQKGSSSMTPYAVNGPQQQKMNNAKSKLSKIIPFKSWQYDMFLFAFAFCYRIPHPYWNVWINFFQTYLMYIRSKYPQGTILRVCMHNFTHVTSGKLVINDISSVSVWLFIFTCM